MSESDKQPGPLSVPSQIPKYAIQPRQGEVITSEGTGNSYTMGEKIGEGAFGVVYSCTDTWGNDLAAKVLKPIRTYEEVKAAAEAEFEKLRQLRNPYITFVYDAFVFRDTFYIITERCYCPVKNLFSIPNFNGTAWLIPLARCLLQAVHYLHIHHYVHQDIHSANVFVAFAKDELLSKAEATQFKLGDLGVARLLHEVSADNTRARWMLPPEVLKPKEFGPADKRIDIYHAALLLLQLAHSRELTFSEKEIIEGKPRSMALQLSAPYSFALEKALRRHVEYRTADALELWRDLHTPSQQVGTSDEL